MKQKIFNRELSWLSFNYRVLQEAKDLSVPLYERIKFLAIFSSNLDEYFRVRVASLRSLLFLNKKSKSKLRFEPKKLLKEIHDTVFTQQEEFGKIFREDILPALNEKNILLIKDSQIEDFHKDFLEDYFNENVRPLIHTSLLDEDNISIFLHNASIYHAVKLSNSTENNADSGDTIYKYAIVEIPSNQLPRFIVLPEHDGKKYVIFLDDVIRYFLNKIFPGYNSIEAYSIKLTRDAELYIDDEFSGDLVEKIRKSLTKRRTGLPCRFLYDKSIPEDFLKYLKKALDLNKEELIPGARYHNFNDFFKFPVLTKEPVQYEEMKELELKNFAKSKNLFNTIKSKDTVIFFPYQKYDYTLQFLQEAAEDKHVQSIRITLYRAASNSKVIELLCKAAKNGKEVIAFLEIKARFDEEANIRNAEALEKGGVKVIFSIPGIKVHAKICLVARSETHGIKHYAYLSTGNFNEKTSAVYSDISLFTANELITDEVKDVYSFIEGNDVKNNFKHILAPPFNLRSGIEELVYNEIENAKAGKKGFILLKLNNLEDKKIIKLLYKASKAGVKIRIVVRGICSLIPGVKGLSENIKVTSIVDRYLEHSRIFLFHNNGDEKIFLSSADLMSRNLNRRVEVCFPVYDIKIKKLLKKILSLYVNDNVKARVIDAKQSNKYVKSRGSKQIRSQYEIYNLLNK